MDNLIIIKYYFLPLFFSFIIAVTMTALIRSLAVKLKIIDYPSEPRKIHDQPIPLLGGLAIFTTFMLVTIIYYQAGLLVDGKIEGNLIFGILLAGLILMINGFLDDKFKLKPRQAIIAPIIACLIVIFFGLKIGYVTNPFGGLLYLAGTFWSPILIFFWLMGMMYTTKFLDGLDGLVSGVAVIGSLILFLVSLFWDVPLSGTSILCLILAGSTLGFLVWNFQPAKIFLGEGGSTFLGFMLGVLAVISGAKIATALLIMGIPILDVIWVIVRRIFKEKKSPFLADKKHLHFRLLDAGLNQRQAVLFLYLLTLLFGATAIFQQTLGKLIALGILIIVMLALGYWAVSGYKKGNI
jgi:UDP-GlcNAc:undecaprenyl-phosphate GlcNAc-1-phosphate transferase